MSNKPEEYYLEDIFGPPVNRQAKVWRYMDFVKFTSLISSKSLYFARFDKFYDKLEGHLPIKNKSAIIGNRNPEIYEGMFNSIIDWQRCHFFNCWHMSEYETATMWSNYADKRYGVAIQSTYELLFQEFKNNEVISLGMVRYLDKYNEPIKNRDNNIDSIHLYYPLFTKHIVYSSEQELRIMYKKIETANLIESGKLFQTSIDHGLSIPVDLERIVENVVLSPYCEPFFKQVVQDVLEKYHHNFSVTESSILIRK